MPDTSSQTALTNAVLIVEDGMETHQRLAAVIMGHPQLDLQTAVESCAAAGTVLAQAAPRVLLTDLGLPDGSGIDLIANVRQTHHCVVISIFGDEKSVVDAFVAGASGYLLKDGSTDYIARQCR